MDLNSFLAQWDWVVLTTILGVDIVLSGDNAVLIALAAAGLPAGQRSKAIMFGMVLAVVLRIVLSLFAVYLLAIPGIRFVGGVVLLYIAYSFYKELRQKDKEDAEGHSHDAPPKSIAIALRQIVVADVSMSLDNVLAVAGAAGSNLPMLIVGLVVSILLMGVAATLIAKLLERFPIIAYIGVALIVWIGSKMVWEDFAVLVLGHGTHAVLWLGAMVGFA